MDLIGPIFYTKRFNETVQFYKELGLELKNLYENEFATFVFLDGRQLGIKVSIESRQIPGSQTMMIKVANIEEFYKSIQKKSWNIVYRLTDEDWGKTFILADPDGNHLEFIESK